MVVGSVLEISRSEHGADFEWRVASSKTVDLLKRRLHSRLFSFAGIKWQMELGLEDPRSSLSSVVLRLLRGWAFPPVTGIRYWLGAGRVDGEEDEIATGRRNPVSSGVEHPWLLYFELQRRKESFAPSGTLSFIVRLRTGPEKDGEMKSLIKLSKFKEKSAPIDLKAEAEQNAAVAECEKSFRRLRTSNSHNAANGVPQPSAKAEKNRAVAEWEQSFHRLRTSNPHHAANVVSEPSGQQPSDECVICCEEAVDCVLYRCGHMCMCYTCAIKVKNSEDSAKCPMCRKPIEDVLKVYK